MMIAPRKFRNALGRFATGITIVTLQDKEAIHGITVNAFMSVSLEPPLVAIAIGKQTRAHGILQRSSRYGVSILRHDQEELSSHFAGLPGADIGDPFALQGDFPLIKGALTHLICRIVASQQAGDHTLFIGQVEHLEYSRGAPLLYYAGRYATLDGSS